MRVDYETALEVASHEAIIRQAYKDSVGVWTWSVGLTSATGHNVERYIGKPQTLQHCLAIYVWALERYADDVREAFAPVTLSKAQFAAALSFHWNTGAIKRASWVRLIKAGAPASEVRAAFMDWNKPPEIVGRRRKEADLFFNGAWSNDGTITEWTRLTAASTPDWRSGRKINVESELRAAFAAPSKPQKEEKSMNPLILATIAGKIAEALVTNPSVPVQAPDVREVRREADKVLKREVAPVIEHLTNNEPWYRSRVTWGGIISIAFGALGVFGVALSEADQETWREVAVEAGPALAGAIGGLIALYGRWKARKPIGA